MDHSGRGVLNVSGNRPSRKAMPVPELSHDDGVDLAVWLHYQVSLVTLWQQYTRMNVLSGDPKAG